MCVRERDREEIETDREGERIENRDIYGKKVERWKAKQNATPNVHSIDHSKG